MSLTNLLFWIIVAIIAYFLLKVSLVILIIVIVVIVIWYLMRRITNNNKTGNLYEGYYEEIPQYYSNIYLLQPNKNEIEYNFDQRIDSYNPSEQNSNWYIPVQSYYNEKQNYHIKPQKCIIPGSISEYCVNKYFQETGNMNLSIAKCSIPIKSSAKCEIN